jgi:hypothetical protein
MVIKSVQKNFSMKRSFFILLTISVFFTVFSIAGVKWSEWGMMLLFSPLLAGGLFLIKKYLGGDDEAEDSVEPTTSHSWKNSTNE